MKPLYILLIYILLMLVLFTACKQETVEPTCTLATTEVFATNVLFAITPVDTLHFSFTNPQGYLIIEEWVDGSINWECIGFTRYDYSYTVDIWTDKEHCTVLIPALNL